MNDISILILFIIVNFIFTFLVLHSESKYRTKKFNQIAQFIIKGERLSKIEDFKIIIEHLKRFQVDEQILKTIPATEVEKEFHAQIYHHDKDIKYLIKLIESMKNFYSNDNHAYGNPIL